MKEQKKKEEISVLLCCLQESLPYLPAYLTVRLLLLLLLLSGEEKVNSEREGESIWSCCQK